MLNTGQVVIDVKNAFRIHRVPLDIGYHPWTTKLAGKAQDRTDN
jgi:hypothetical protein